MMPPSLSFPRKQEPSSVVYPKRLALWVPAFAGMTNYYSARKHNTFGSDMPLT